MEQQDAERAVIHHAPGQLRDPREQLVQVHERGHVAANLGERFKGFGVEPLLFKQARVDQRQRHVRGKLAQDGRIAFRIHVARSAQHVERADGLVLVHQRHGQRRRHARHHFHVGRLERNVAHHHGFLGADHMPHNAVGDAGTIVRGIRVSHAVGDPQLAVSIVQQVDGKRVKWNQAANQLGNLLQELVQFHHRRHLAAEIKQGQQDIALMAARRQV